MLFFQLIQFFFWFSGQDAVGHEQAFQAGSSRTSDVMLDTVADAKRPAWIDIGGQRQRMAIDLGKWLADPADVATKHFIDLGDAAGAETWADRGQHDLVGIGANAHGFFCGSGCEQPSVVMLVMAVGFASGDQDEIGLARIVDQRDIQAVDGGTILIPRNQKTALGGEA